jgi:signal transduction histidine kinase
MAGRVAAADGHLSIESPPGGPTTLTVDLPCAS